MTIALSPRSAAALLRPVRLPVARGPLSGAVRAILQGDPSGPLRAPLPAVASADPVADDDLQLALYCLYELHYRGFADVDDGWEWDARLLRFRSALEEPFERALRAAVQPGDEDVVDALHRAAALPGPSVSRFLADRGDLHQCREFAVHRSAYQLKEADPHSWVIPRLDGDPKSALLQVQMEEYGDGLPGQMHSQLFRQTMEALGLDPRYGAYLDALPGSTLATTNLISMFGLHRRLRGALVGHLALFEMTSVVPMGRYAAALHRVGAPAAAAVFYEVHVDADQSHERIACEQMAGGLARDEPDQAREIGFGALAAVHVEARFGAALLDAWAAGRSSLLQPLPC